MGENAIGIVGMNDNIRNVTLSNIGYRRKESNNLCLKGERFDLEPSKVVCNVSKDEGLIVQGVHDVKLVNVNTGKWKQILR